jgi:hypothetical protein
VKPVTILTVALLLLLASACGQNYTPEDDEKQPAEGEAAPLGEQVDLEVSLPNVVIPGSSQRGVELEMTIEIAESGHGRHEARYVLGRARAGMSPAEADDLSNGRTTVTISDSVWTTGRIGPLRIEGAVFEMILDGVPEDGGWFVSGRARESQTTMHGTFRGWRRHRFLVAGTDFFSGGVVSEVALVKESEVVVRRNLVTVSSDPVLRLTGRAVFAVNRLSYDNLQRLDPDRDFVTVWQAGTGVGANPQDVLWISDDKAYVTRYEPPFNDVAVVDPRYGTTTSSIVLEELADNRDGTPRADRVVAAEGAVFVGLQDIDRTFTRYEEAKLAVIDPARDEVVGEIPLGGKNPGEIEMLTGQDGRVRLYVALGGIFPGLLPQELSGGVVVVNAFARAVEYFALDDDDAGGNIAGLAVFSDRLAYAIVTDAEYRNRVVAFDPEEAEVLRMVWDTQEYVPEIEIDRRGILAVPDRTFTGPRLCLYRAPADPSAAEVAIGCAAFDLPPISIEALD